MPAPRPSHSAEAARAAAVQAEFNEKKWVWVPDEVEGYLAGWVNKEEDDVGEIIMAAGGDVRYFCCFNLLYYSTNSRRNDLVFLRRSGECHFTLYPR